ncbi:amidohydrolase [Candidatus Bipolaricaulota bacterium]|nr:amidohydrolase [Candidatus Bipolaricaulota bacterium]
MAASRVETILTQGVFPTVPGVDSVAMGRGRILAVGTEEEVLFSSCDTTRVIDLAGRAVLPGFIDSHTHFLQTGLARIGLHIDLSGLSREEVFAQLAGAVRERGAGEWVVGRGWDESTWQDHHFLSREELDRLAPDSPLIAIRLDGHLLVVNTVALERIPSAVDRRGVDEECGIVREKAAFDLLQSISPDEETLRAALHAAVSYAHKFGITSIHTMLPLDWVHAYMRERGRIELRVTLCPEVPALGPLETLGMTSGFGDEWLRLGGVKLFADGSIGAGNAALDAPYTDSGQNGALNYRTQDLSSFIERAERAGLQTVIHAIGGRAIEQVLDAHATVGTSRELRHRIEHFELPTRTQIERARELGLNISMQPNFVGNWSGEGKMYQARLGEERDSMVDPHHLVLEKGLPLAFGSDSMPISPLYGLHWAVNAPHESQRIKIEEGIRCYTEEGARLSFEEEEKGRIETGMLADLVVLDKDPREDPMQIDQLRVEMTFLAGKIVYQRGETACG